jgi:hypothetical protein
MSRVQLTNRCCSNRMSSGKRNNGKGRNPMSSCRRWKPSGKLMVGFLFLLFLELQNGTPMWAQANATTRIAGVVSDSGRISLLGPDFFNTGMALSRVFALGETRRVEVLFEAFNVTNHTNFAAAANSFKSSQLWPDSERGRPAHPATRREVCLLGGSLRPHEIEAAFSKRGMSCMLKEGIEALDPKIGPQVLSMPVGERGRHSRNAPWGLQSDRVWRIEVDELG